jgi:MFS superfamily sulfate permease-like transporter
MFKNKFNFSHFKNDLPAGLVVWLVALPLCLGIAQGSDADPFAGIIAGIIGGLVVTIFSGSKFGVSGPAAGLITIVVAAIAELGYEVFLLAVVLSGIIQFLLGLFRLGIVGYFIPTSVIHGMLAAIGITLILKQIPHALGVDSDPEGDMSLNQVDGENTFSEILLSFENLAIGAFIIFLISMIILLVWELPWFKKNEKIKLIPVSLIVVALGALINQLFGSIGGNFGEMTFLGSSHLVDLPEALSSGNYKKLIVLPDFSIEAFSNKDVYVYAITIALVASIETLLCLEATDKLDPDKNISPTNKELKAQGIGNFLSGLIGGLPITMVIVRSSANINAYAKTQMSAFYHGLFLLISVFAFPNILEYIPLSSLAAILVLIGFKLVKINNIIKLFKTDWENGLVIVITIIAVLLTDLLSGVGVGFLVAMFFLLRRNYELAFISHVDTKNRKTIISFAQIVSFLNKGALMTTLQDIPNGSTVVVSAKKCHTMSKEIQEVMKDFRDITSKKNNINLELIGFEKFLSTEETNSNKRFFLNASSIIILKRFQNEIKSSTNEEDLSFYKQMLKDIFFVNNLFYDDYKSYRDFFYYKGTILTKNTNQLKKEFSKFYKTIIDNTISNDELYEEWMSLSNDDKIKNIISTANKDISQFHKQKKLKKEYFEFWKLIHKSVSEISNFKVKEFNN